MEGWTCEMNRNKNLQKDMHERIEVERLNPSPDEGLNAEQINLRLRAGYGNAPVNPPSKSVGQIVRSNVFTFFNFIFFLLAFFIILVGSFRDLMFMPIVIANIFIGIVQEIRAKKTIDKLMLLSSPKAIAVREGREYTVDTSRLVLDDVVVFSAGNQICADAVILRGEVQVNESLITGEAKAVIKGEGDSLLSGSFIISGKCYAQLDAVGADSYASRLTVEAKKDKKKKRSEMMASLNRLIQIIGIVIIPVGIMLYYQQTVELGLSVRQAVVSTVAALVGMIPEGLYLLASVALAVSVVRLARYKTLVHELSCIETLARVDVLCVDKTGTITENTMQVQEIVLLDEPVCNETQLYQAMSAFYNNLPDDNATANAMREYFSDDVVWRAVKTVPFNSANKWSAVDFGRNGAYVVGAPEFVLKNEYENLRETVEEYSNMGYRVLLIAGYDGQVGDGLGGKVSPLALALVANKIRDTAPETFGFFAEQGVEIKVISGDNPITVSMVAAQAGIANAERYVDASTLTTPQLLEQAAQEYTVFGRVTPDQKRKLVRALKACGHTVAMTGDGVNDVLALKDADCSIAMASGSDAACHVSQLVLLNSDFSSMPKVVLEGRRVINNIERAASLFLVKNIFSFVMALLAMFIAMPYPVTPAQLSLVSTLTIGAPAFLLALEPNKNLVSGRFLTNVIKRALPGALTDIFLVMGLQAFAEVFELPMSDLSTMCAVLMAWVGLLVLYQVCKPIDIKRGAIWAAMTVAVIFSITVLADFFVLHKLSVGATLVFTVFALLAYPVMRAILWSFGKIGLAVTFIRKRRARKK